MRGEESIARWYRFGNTIVQSTCSESAQRASRSRRRRKKSVPPAIPGAQFQPAGRSGRIGGPAPDDPRYTAL